ncbi:MAG TPA: hypothetical protein VMH39_08185, partial [Gemmatimonadaceae bacterium]|nr:hypothetical protein [Gemmatimonadaceae bacterium]
RPLGPIIATTGEHIERVAQVRVLSDRRILVHDQVARRVLLFDSTLTHARSIIDTTGATQKAYGDETGTLFPFTGDSSLFVDPTSGAILVLDPSGAVARIAAVPANPLRPRFPSAYLSQTGVMFDRQGHFVFAQTIVAPRRDIGVPTATLPQSAIAPDTVPLVRIGLLSRREDTLATLTRSPSFASGVLLAVDPLPEADRWTVLSDGTVAIVRAHDYHIDWVAPDGAVTSSPPIAHEWRRLTDSLKVVFLDSARRSDSVEAQARVDSMGGIDAMVKARRARASARSGSPAQTDSQIATSIRAVWFPPYVPAWLLPDYVPPFSPELPPGDLAVAADADGAIWIRVGIPGAQGGSRVYDVVSRKGILVDRVQLPGGTSIVGFGPGVVYLAAREGSGMQVARARIR